MCLKLDVKLHLVARKGLSTGQRHMFIDQVSKVPEKTGAVGLWTEGGWLAQGRGENGCSG